MDLWEQATAEDELEAAVARMLSGDAVEKPAGSAEEEEKKDGNDGSGDDDDQNKITKTKTKTNSHDQAGPSEGSATVLRIAGIGLLLIGSFTHSVTNVINERYIRDPDDPFPATALCTIIGFWSFLAWLVYFLVVFFFFFEGYQKVDTTGAVVAGAGFWLSSFVHAACFFILLGKVGNVTAGVVKGLTTLSVTFVACFFFWVAPVVKDRQYALGPWNTSAALVCGAGVILYSFATKSATNAAKEQEGEIARLYAANAAASAAPPTPPWRSSLELTQRAAAVV